MEDASDSHNRELSRCFRGVARVPLDNLNFDHILFQKQHRPVSQHIVNQLRQVFEKEGLRRYEPRNWIDALVDPQHLASILAENGLLGFGSEVEGIPMLQFGPLDCLQGIHRILAASDLLRQNDRWWPVRLYTSELPRDICIGIIEDSLNERQHSDGEIFRKIRIYHKQGDERAERKWWARLSRTKQKDLKQLFNSADLTGAFDRLVDMPGMWRSFQLGALHRLLTLHCDEELLRYLTRVADVWERILQAANAPPETVDRVTVEKLELLAPSVSSRDRSRVESLISSGEVFPGIAHASIRHEILSAFLSTPGLIPSLTSFFENLKYLEPCCHILKKLLPAKERRTIYQSLSASYLSPNEQLVEHSTGRRVMPMNNDKEDLWLAYAQLWAFCMRHFPSMSETAPRKVIGRAKPLKNPNHALWHFLGDLAVKVGFRTVKALELQRQNPYGSLAEQLLRSLHPSSPPDARHVLRVAAALQEVEHDSKVGEIPSLTRTEPLPVEKRCGRPFEDDFLLDRDFLFVPTIYEIEESEGLEISTLFVKRDIFMSFLGDHYTQRPTHDARPDDDTGFVTRSSAPHDVPGTSAWSSLCEESRPRELTKALDEERQQTDQLRRLSEEMQDRISSLLEEAEERNRTSRTLETRTVELVGRCTDLESRAKNLDAHIQEREQLHDGLRRMNIELEKKLAEKEKQAGAHRTAYQAEKRGLEKQLKECQFLNEQLNEELDSSKILRREGHDKTRKLQEHVESLQSLLTKAEESVNVRVLELQKKQLEIGRLQSEIREQELANGRLRKNETKLMESQKDLQYRLTESMERANHLEIEVRELSNTTELLKKEKLETSDADARQRPASRRQRQRLEELSELLSISLEDENIIIGLFIITLRIGEFWIKIPAQSSAAKIERVLRVIASMESAGSEHWDTYSDGRIVLEAGDRDPEHIATLMKRHRFFYAGPRSIIQAMMTEPDRQPQQSHQQTVNARKRKGLALDTAPRKVQEDGKQFALTKIASEVNNQNESKQAPVSGTRAANAVKESEGLGEGSKLTWRDTFSEDEITRRRIKFHHMVLEDSETRDNPPLP